MRASEVVMKRHTVLLSEEVRAALADGLPVVALESSVLVQGLPPPHNLDSARVCANAVREGGAVPALTAVVDGRPCAGLDEVRLAELTDPKKGARKIGLRDFASAWADRAWGATTVSGTVAIADAVGIRLFATGGIGGVHREAERTFDVSQDLLAISRCQVAVVTAGAKAILDLPRTLEALEALAVPVVGYRTDEFPGFYTNQTGLKLESRLDEPKQAAALLRARFDELGQGGVVIANPVPAADQADAKRIGEAIEAALRDAAAKGVKGKALTPFLLAEVSRRSGGESLQTNLSLLTHNARVAAQIAAAYRAAAG
jgi:pseudouridine-5'-phosphate glycosidase